MLKQQIQEIQKSRQGSKPPFDRLTIGAKIYQVIDFKKTRVKGRKGQYRWQTDRSQITVKHVNTGDFSYLNGDSPEFNIALEDLTTKDQYGYSKVKFYNNDKEAESKEGNQQSS